MPGRRTNLALLVLLTAAFGSGWVAFAAGTRWGTAVVIAHGVAGLALLLLVPWKTPIVRRGLRRNPARTTVPSVVLTATTGVTVASGVVQSAGVLGLGPLTTMQAHVGGAVVALVAAGWHLVDHPTVPRARDLDRRAFLRTGVLLGGALLLREAVDVGFRAAGAEGATRRYTGSHERGSGAPATMPVTQWLDDPVPRVDRDAWRLAIRDAAGRRELALADVTATAEVTAVIDCTGGWYAEQTWSGVPLRDLVEAGTARSLVVRSVTGYARRFPARDLDRLWLATRVAGAPLSAGHGAPARLVAPGRRGFWWVKWVDAIVVSDRPWWVQPPFPLT